MGLLNTITKYKNKHRLSKYAKFMNGKTPIFSQFGENIYASDIVQDCINCIATECSKLEPKHMRNDPNGLQVRVNSEINRLFKFAPNELMTTKDFLEKIIWQLYLNYNVFIYPMYRDGQYTGFYPLDPKVVTFKQDDINKIFVEMRFGNGDTYTLPYESLIHLRLRYSVNDVMGGGMNGQPDNEALLKVLDTNNTVIQGLDKAIKTSMEIRGIYKYGSMVDEKKLIEEKEKFEKRISSGKTGILPLDVKGEYIPIDIDPKIIDKDTMEFLEMKVLKWFGVSLPILTGDFTDEQYQAFYEKTIEPLVISLGQAFSKTLFSKEKLNHGNEIVFYPQKLLFTNVKNKIAVADILGNRGALTNNALLELFGYPPYEGGDERYMSLNYVDVNIANQYQLNKARMEGNNGQKTVTD